MVTYRNRNSGSSQHSQAMPQGRGVPMRQYELPVIGCQTVAAGRYSSGAGRGIGKGIEQGIGQKTEHGLDGSMASFGVRAHPDRPAVMHGSAVKPHSNRGPRRAEADESGGLRSCQRELILAAVPPPGQEVIGEEVQDQKMPGQKAVGQDRRAHSVCTAGHSALAMKAAREMKCLGRDASKRKNGRVICIHLQNMLEDQGRANRDRMRIGLGL
jgi:hypothetical protein